jgi:hypothetical protein
MSTSIIELNTIRPSAYYRYEKSEHAKSVYVLIEHRGQDIQFMAMGKKGDHAGLYTVRKFKKPNSNHEVIVSEIGHVTKLEYGSIENPGRAYGDLYPTSTAILVQVSNDESSLEIWFFPLLKKQVVQLFELWNQGELNMQVNPSPITMESSLPDQLPEQP